MSSSTHFPQVFLPPPLHFTPATTTFLQADTQSSPLLRSTCPNHLNQPRLTTSATFWTPNKLYKSTLRFLSFSDTPHIHLTVIRSVLSRLCKLAFFIAQVSVPYVNTLWTQALYILPFMRYEAPRTVSIGDNSLNLAQAVQAHNKIKINPTLWIFHHYKIYYQDQRHPIEWQIIANQHILLIFIGNWWKEWFNMR